MEILPSACAATFKLWRSGVGGGGRGQECKFCATHNVYIFIFAPKLQIFLKRSLQWVQYQKEKLVGPILKREASGRFNIKKEKLVGPISKKRSWLVKSQKEKLVGPILKEKLVGGSISKKISQSVKLQKKSCQWVQYQKEKLVGPI